MIEICISSVPIPSNKTTQQESEDAVDNIQALLNIGWAIEATNVVETHIVYTLLKGEREP